MLVLGSAFPDQLPDFIAYQLLIVKHSVKFDYLGVFQFGRLASGSNFILHRALWQYASHLARICICHSPPQKKGQIPDIATWVQVYNTYMFVLGSAFPDQLPNFIAYQLLIVKHSVKFDYPSWLRYEVDFRQWAVATGFHSWSWMHPQFYAFAYTAQGRATTWCPICHTEGGSHTYDCPKFSPSPHLALPQPAPLLRQTFRPSMQFQAPNSGPQHFSDIRPPPPKRQNPEHCILFNKNNGNCPHGERCVKIHMCAFCKTKGHPVTQCPSKLNLHNCFAMHCTDLIIIYRDIVVHLILY